MYKNKIKFNILTNLWLEQNTPGLCYTYQKTLHSIISHINAFLGDKYISDITPYEITVMINTLAQSNPNTNKPMSKQTLRVLITTTYRIFDMAVDNDWIRKNPAKGKTKNIPKNAPKKVVTSISKPKQLAILNTPHRCHIAALIMMLLGLRTGELIALEWQDIDLINKKAHICKHAVRVSSNKYEVFQGTKTGKSRYVTIPDNLSEFLAEEMKKATSVYVFPKTDGTLNTPSSWKSAWHSYINALNFYEYSKNNLSNTSKYSPKGYPKLIKINPHQLRHTYATLLYVSGVDVLTASKLLGHSNVQITLNIYTHLDEVYKTLDISNFNEYLSSDLCKV